MRHQSKRHNIILQTQQTKPIVLGLLPWLQIHWKCPSMLSQTPFMQRLPNCLHSSMSISNTIREYKRTRPGYQCQTVHNIKIHIKKCATLEVKNLTNIVRKQKMVKSLVILNKLECSITTMAFS